MLNFDQRPSQKSAMAAQSTVKEVGDVYPQGVSDQQQVAELHLVTGFHPLDRRPVQAARVSEGLLGHVLVQAPHADAVADGPAGLRDPLG
jgi:hypothetical protein